MTHRLTLLVCPEREAMRPTFCIQVPLLHALQRRRQVDSVSIPILQTNGKLNCSSDLLRSQSFRGRHRGLELLTTRHTASPETWTGEVLGTAILFSGVIGFCPGKSLRGEPLLVLASCRRLTSAECLGPRCLHLHLLCNGHNAIYAFSFEKEEFGPIAL